MRYSYILAGLGVLVGLIGASSVWWTISLSSGALIVVSGLDASPVVWSLAGLAVAAYGASVTLRGVARRVTQALGALASLGGAYAVVYASAEPISSALSTITDATGISGAGARELVNAVTVSGSHWVSITGFILFAAGGTLGSLTRSASGGSSRYERRARSASLEDSVATWDEMSGGGDPTER